MFDFLNPYSLAIKIGAAAIGLIALGVLLWSWHSRGQEIDALTSWQQTVVMATTDATVTPDAKGIRKSLKPEQVAPAIAGLKRSLDGANAAIDVANGQVTDAKKRADLADAQLSVKAAAFDRLYASTSAKITALQNRKPAATPAAACEAVDADSKAAWEGWH